jgi:hypothetical protein
VGADGFALLDLLDRPGTPAGLGQDAELLVRSREEHGIALVGPGRPDPSWQARVEGALTAERFEVD